MCMQFITELSIVVLMVGTFVGGITQIGEAGCTGILYFNPDATGPMVEGSGRILMVIFVVAIVAPLCALKNMRWVSIIHFELMIRVSLFCCSCSGSNATCSPRCMLAVALLHQTHPFLMQ